MLQRIAPAPGMVLLEIAGGLGDTALMAAPALLPGGRVILTDRSPAMVEAARRRVEGEGVDNIECRAMDAARSTCRTPASTQPFAAGATC